MFNFFRKGMGSMFAGILLAFLIASFALWGIGDPLSSLGSNDVAEVGDEKITINEYARAFDMDFRQTQQRFGDTFTKELAVQFGFGDQVINQLTDRKAYDVEAKNIGLRTPDQELRDYILSIPAFQDATGAFNKSYFDQMARGQNISPKDFESLMRNDLVRQKFASALMNSIYTPEIITNTLTKYVTEERVAEVLTIPASNMTSIGEVTDEMLQTFYDDNNPLYMAPEYRDLSYFEISASEIARAIDISDEAALDEYEARIADYTQEEERGFVQMLLDDMDVANAAYAELEAGKSFDEVISDKTGDTAEDSTFEPETRSDFSDLYGEDAATELYNLADGGYTSPIETGFGVYIFKLGATSPGSSQSFDEVKESLIANMQSELAIDRLFELQNLIDDELAAGAPIGDIAAVVEASLSTVKNVSIEGMSPEGNASNDLPLIVEFLDLAFQKNIGDEMILHEGLANKFYMIDVDNIYDAKLKEFDVVKEIVTADWSARRRNELATELSDRIAEELSADGAEEKLLAEYQNADNGDFSFSELTVDRGNAENTVAADIHTSIFAQDVGGIEKISAANGDGFVLVRVKERLFNDDADEEEVAESETQINTALQNDLMGAFSAHLQDSLPVIINQNTVKAVLDQIVSPVDQ